jgi:hypothetical protein
MQSMTIDSAAIRLTETILDDEGPDCRFPLRVDPGFPLRTDPA